MTSEDVPGWHWYCKEHETWGVAHTEIEADAMGMAHRIFIEKVEVLEHPEDGPTCFIDVHLCGGDDEPDGESMFIMPAEYQGMALDNNGSLEVGGLRVPWEGGSVGVYVRRRSNDLAVCEIHLASHDGYASEELEERNRQAELYPLGPKEYWRGEMVGKYRSGADGHLMTEEDFELEWQEQQA